MGEGFTTSVKPKKTSLPVKHKTLRLKPETDFQRFPPAKNFTVRLIMLHTTMARLPKTSELAASLKVPDAEVVACGEVEPSVVLPSIPSVVVALPVVALSLVVVVVPVVVVVVVVASGKPLS